MLFIFLILLIPLVIVWVYHNIQYKKSGYYQITHNSYWSTRNDKGKFGEYMTYKYLSQYENYGCKFLFNLYIPKENNQTTEIDVIMISPKGIFVFESKNYSGWIFGDEHRRQWCQTLPKGRRRSQKSYFYNPIIQNQTHIKYLSRIINANIPLHSIIVFSDRCVLKNINIENHLIHVINRYMVSATVSAIYNSIPDLILSRKLQ